MLQGLQNFDKLCRVDMLEGATTSRIRRRSTLELNADSLPVGEGCYRVDRGSQQEKITRVSRCAKPSSMRDD